MSFVPSKIFFTKGVGRHKEYLSSFELALREAKIEKCNLVTVSSIFPPHCERISVEEGLKLLSPGQITFAVMARNSTNEYNRLIAASVGVAIPADETQYGYLSEHHPYGESEELANMRRIWLQPCWQQRLALSSIPTKIGMSVKAFTK